MDDAAAAMLSQVLKVQGASVATVSHTALPGRDIHALLADGIDTVLVTFLNGNSKSHARQIVRRLKRSRPALRVGIVMPMADGQRNRQIEADEIDADFVVPTITQAVRSALTSSSAVPVRNLTRKLARPRVRPALEV
jgi:hypothetical protein